MRWILDGIVVAIMVIAVIIGAKKGFLKSVLGLLGMILVFALASKLSAPVGGFLDSKIINPAYRSRAASQFSEKLGIQVEKGNEENQILQYEKEVEEYDSTHDTPILSLFAVAKNDVTEAVEHARESAKASAVKAMFALVDKASASVSRVIAFILLLAVGIVLLIVLKLIIKPLLRAFRLRRLDAFLGALLGVVCGALVVMLVALVLRFAQPMFGGKMTNEAINDTYVYKYAYSLMGGEIE